MTAPLAPDVIGYSKSGDNRVLRWALFQVWKQRCYSCTEPKVFAETQIDHIIPSAAAARLPELIRKHGLDADFHLDRPANLALICALCNRGKSKRNLLDAQVTTNNLHTAKGYAAKVERLCHAFDTASEVAKGLIGASLGDPYDEAIRADYLEFAPAIVRTLALIDEDRASDFTSLRHLQVRGQRVMLGVDPRGRFALSVITEICGDTVEDVLETVLPGLIAQISEHADEYLREGWEAGTLARTRENHLYIHIIDLQRAGATITVRFLGGLRHDFAASIPDTQGNLLARRVSTAPEELLAGVTFELTARWDLSAPAGAARTVEVSSTEFDVEESTEFEVDEVLPS